MITDKLITDKTSTLMERTCSRVPIISVFTLMSSVQNPCLLRIIQGCSNTSKYIGDCHEIGNPLRVLNTALMAYTLWLENQTSTHRGFSQL